MRMRILSLFDHSFGKVVSRHFQGNERGQVEFAYVKACYAHKDQAPRHNGDPYITHPERIVKCMVAQGLRRADYAALGLLHDIFEDCAFLSRGDVSEIRDRLGSDIVDELHMLSKRYANEDLRPSNHSEGSYYQVLRHSPRRVQIVKMFDRLDNLLDIHEKHIAPDKRERVKHTTQVHFVPMARDMLQAMSRTDDMRHIVQFLHDEFVRLSKR